MRNTRLRLAARCLSETNVDSEVVVASPHGNPPPRLPELRRSHSICAIGEVEALCGYCASRLKFIPEDNELEVVKTREEMKHRERVEVEKQILRNRLKKEEMDRWRETAAKVAIAAVPIVGRTAGRAAFNYRGAERWWLRRVWVSRFDRCACRGGCAFRVVREGRK